MSHYQTTGKENHSKKITYVAHLMYFGTTVTSWNDKDDEIRASEV